MKYSQKRDKKYNPFYELIINIYNSINCMYVYFFSYKNSYNANIVTKYLNSIFKFHNVDRQQNVKLRQKIIR